MNSTLSEMALVGAGGAVGAMLRYGVALVVTRLSGPSFVATLAVNVVGCFCMGVLLAGPGALGSGRARLLLGTGVLGGFTTFSTFAADTDALAAGHGARAAAYVLASILGGIGAFFMGRSLGGA